MVFGPLFALSPAPLLLRHRYHFGAAAIVRAPVRFLWTDLSSCWYYASSSASTRSSRCARLPTPPPSLSAANVAEAVYVWRERVAAALTLRRDCPFVWRIAAGMLWITAAAACFVLNVWLQCSLDKLRQPQSCQLHQCGFFFSSFGSTPLRDVYLSPR